MLSDLVELAAYAAFVVAGWLLSPIAGLVVLGVVLWVLAQALDGVKVALPRVAWPKIRVKSPRLGSPRPRPVGARSR